jgi:hypothetical protein
MTASLDTFLATLYPKNDADKHRGPAVNLLTELRGKELEVAEDAIISLLKDGGYWEGVICLYQHPSKRFVPIVKEILRSPERLKSLYVVELAHWLWMQNEFPEADRFIRGRLQTLHPADRFTRAAIAERLGKYPSPENKGVLMDLATHDPDSDVRCRALWGLAVMAKAISDWMDALKDPQNYQWLRVLGGEMRSKDPKHWEATVEALLKELERRSLELPR